MKWLLWLLILGLGFLWITRSFRGAVARAAKMAKAESPPHPAPATEVAEPAATAMLTCARCGVHLPANEAVLDPARRPYCTEAHRLAGRRAP